MCALWRLWGFPKENLSAATTFEGVGPRLELRMETSEILYPPSALKQGTAQRSTAPAAPSSAGNPGSSLRPLRQSSEPPQLRPPLLAAHPSGGRSNSQTCPQPPRCCLRARVCEMFNPPPRELMACFTKNIHDIPSWLPENQKQNMDAGGCCCKDPSPVNVPVCQHVGRSKSHPVPCHAHLTLVSNIPPQHCIEGAVPKDKRNFFHACSQCRSKAMFLRKRNMLRLKQVPPPCCKKRVHI